MTILLCPDSICGFGLVRCKARLTSHQRIEVKITSEIFKSLEQAGHSLLLIGDYTLVYLDTVFYS